MRTGAAGMAMALTAGALALGGCGDDAQDGPAEDPPAEQPGDKPPPPTPASKYGADDPEALLATIDNGGDKPTDAEIDPYAKRLDAMERVCRERRSLLADQVVTGVKLLKDEKGLKYTNAEVARAYTNALTDKAGTNQKCAELFAGVVAATTAEE